VDQAHHGSLVNAFGHPRDSLNQTGQFDDVFVPEVTQNLWFQLLQVFHDFVVIVPNHFGLSQLLIQIGLDLSDFLDCLVCLHSQGVNIDFDQRIFVVVLVDHNSFCKAYTVSFDIGIDLVFQITSRHCWIRVFIIIRFGRRELR